MRLVVVWACALILSFGAATAGTLSNLYTGFFALGDSLSDPGNVFAATGGTFPPPPYANGHFSNGPTFAEYLAQGFAPSTVHNFAYGGARAVNPGVPSATLHLDQQLALVQGAAQGGGATGALVTMLFGANDIIGELDNIIAAPPADPIPQLVQTATAAAQAVASAVATLVQYSPAEIVVLNLPDLGATPAYASTPFASLASFATDVFNSAIAGVAGLSNGTTQVSVFELNGLFASAQAMPAEYGLDRSLLEIPCFVAGAEPDCEGYLFADSVHPTTRVHALLAGAVADGLGKDQVPAPVPLPASLPMLAAGLGMIAFLRRRRSA